MKKAMRPLALLLGLALLFSLAACGKSEYVKNAEALIAAIGEVSVESEEAIEAAEKAYDALTDEDKAKVENAPALPLARAALEKAREQKAAEELEALRRSLLGTWQAEIEMGELIQKLLSPDDLALIGDYIQQMPVNYTLTLREDNTFSYTYDESSLRAYFQSLRETVRSFLLDSLTMTLADALRANGYALEGNDLASVEAALGMTLDEFLLETQGVSFDELMQSVVSDELIEELSTMNLNTEGQFSVEPGKLHLSTSLQESPREGDYNSFVLEGDTLTFSDFAGTSVFEMVYPIRFVRVG